MRCATRHRGRARSFAASAAQQKPPPQPRPPPAAAFDTTPSLVKGLVSALTGLVNAASGSSLARGDNSAVDTQQRGRPPVTPAEVAAGIRGDFTERGYLWTGQISAELYDAETEFTDPTLTFRGLATFQRNLAALQPVLRAVLRTREIDLLELTESDEESFVEAAWRMGGDLALPWQPRIELTGRTRFYYSPARGGRIVRYVESWDIPATEALLQILRPFAWKKGATASDRSRV